MAPRKLDSWRASFRSGLESDTFNDLKEKGVTFEYEPSWGKIKYIEPAKTRTYSPDFFITTRSGKQIIVETKGIWDRADREKHRLIKLQHPDLDIRFVFHRSKSKIRKDSKTTYADICSGKGWGPFKNLTWKFADKKIPQEWLDE